MFLCPEGKHPHGWKSTFNSLSDICDFNQAGTVNDLCVLLCLLFSIFILWASARETTQIIKVTQLMPYGKICLLSGAMWDTSSQRKVTSGSCASAIIWL